MDTLRFAKALTILFFMSFKVANGQIHGCSLQGIDIRECLDQAANLASLDSCCKALNNAVQAGSYCLCLLLRSSTPLLGFVLSLKVFGCDVALPPLTQCQNSLPVYQAPDTPVPALDHPPAASAKPSLPMKMPPSEMPKQLLQPSSTPNHDIMLPLPPKRNEIPLSSTPVSALDHPAAASARQSLPVKTPPSEMPKQLLQPSSTPNHDIMLPLPPKRNEIPLSSPPVPALDHPAAASARQSLPVKTPPSEMPKQLLQPSSTPNDIMLPLPPKRNEIPLNSTLQRTLP